MIRTYGLSFIAALAVMACGCGSGSGRAALQQGLAALQEKNYSGAIAHLTTASKRITDSSALYYSLGLAHLHQGNIEPALGAFSAALELEPSHAGALTCVGQIAYLQNDLNKAQACYEQALEAAADDAMRTRILTSLALVEAGRNRYDLARLHLIHALKLSRANPYAPALYNLASLYRDAFNLREEALDNFEMYVRMADRKDPHYDKAANNIKRLRLNLERTQAEELDRVRRNPSAAAKLLREGTHWQVEKQYAKAIKYYSDALLEDPFTFNAAFGLAVTCKNQGLRAEAMEAFLKATVINPDYQDCYYQAAELALQLKRYAEAAKILDRAIARSPYHAANVELMARIRYSEKRLPEARAYGEFYLSLLRAEDKNRAAYETWVRSLPKK